MYKHVVSAKKRAELEAARKARDDDSDPSNNSDVEDDLSEVEDGAETDSDDDVAVDGENDIIFESNVNPDDIRDPRRKKEKDRRHCEICPERKFRTELDLETHLKSAGHQKRLKKQMRHAQDVLLPKEYIEKKKAKAAKKRERRRQKKLEQAKQKRKEKRELQKQQSHSDASNRKATATATQKSSTRAASKDSKEAKKVVESKKNRKASKK
eukprot:Clim_evm35s150 gene=Clim_evmTU35s150